jgi:hypothetical protein
MKTGNTVFALLFNNVNILFNMIVINESYPCSRLRRLMRLWGVEDPTLNIQSASRWRWDCSPHGQETLYSSETFVFLSLLLICVRGCVKAGPSPTVRAGRLIKCIHIKGNIVVSQLNSRPHNFMELEVSVLSSRNRATGHCSEPFTWISHPPLKLFEINFSAVPSMSEFYHVSLSLSCSH